jgi:hypothetical protein
MQISQAFVGVRQTRLTSPRSLAIDNKETEPVRTPETDWIGNVE